VSVRGGDLLEVSLGRRLDHDVGGRDQVLEREQGRGRAKARQEASGALMVAGEAAGEAEPGNALVQRATDRAADHPEADDADAPDLLHGVSAG